MVLLISPLRAGGYVTQNQSVKSAATSAIGMAEMLAHEIKNPLAGITGAAQLLSMNLGKEDLELTDLIVSETRRIVSLLEQVEQFGNVSPPVLRGQYPRRARPRPPLGASWGLPPIWRCVRTTTPRCPCLGRSRPAVAGGPEPDQERLGGGGQQGRHDHAAHLLRTIAAGAARSGGAGKALPLADRDHRRWPRACRPRFQGQVFEPFVSGRENGTGLGLALACQDHFRPRRMDFGQLGAGRTVFRISLPRAQGDHGGKD
jgi:two-component system nitrogen regulation sensor histidine kinase GlnL